jgi:lysine-N-methylase
LPQAGSVHPKYADSFRCIGSDCEDTCCQGWSVPIDKPTWEKYQNLPQGPLSDRIRANMTRTSANSSTEPDAADAGKAVFAIISMNEANQCPLLTEKRLCGIQAELGEELLSHTCATYPRIVHSAGGVEEKALALSCPEAARIVLLTPNILGEADVTEPATGLNLSSTDEGAGTLPANFWPIRSVVLKLVQNRLYPLWQRLFLLEVLCRRLDAIAQGESDRGVPAFLADFEASVATGSLRQAMEKLPIDRAAQLDVVLRLAGLMLHKSNVRSRFVECIQAFTAGIGNGAGATLETLTAQYTLAHDRCYAPFFDRYPHIMENFLINTIIRCQFPFGKEGMRAGAQPNRSREFALLTAQFALMRGLLIGVAGHHGAAFSTAHVVHTVQAASKHFEHHPEFLNMAHALLVEANMDGARGLAILLRNVETDRSETDRPAMNRRETNPGAGEARPASERIYVQAPQGGRSVSAPAPPGTVHQG